MQDTASNKFLGRSPLRCCQNDASYSWIGMVSNCYFGTWRSTSQQLHWSTLCFSNGREPAPPSNEFKGRSVVRAERNRHVGTISGVCTVHERTLPALDHPVCFRVPFIMSKGFCPSYISFQSISQVPKDCSPIPQYGHVFQICHFLRYDDTCILRYGPWRASSKCCQPKRC